MAGVLWGPRKWSLTKNSKGYRTYKIVVRVNTDHVDDGPHTVLTTTPNLPQPGDIWAWGHDLDPWVTCRHDAEVAAASGVIEGEPHKEWDVEFTYSNEPIEQCQDLEQEDPLLQPNRVSGSFRKVTKEATKDRYGRALTNSAHEQLRGPTVEFDNSYPTIRIEQNVPDLQFNLLCQMIETVNDNALWGFTKRTIKLSRISWECLYTGNCQPYIKRVLEFEIDPATWDREILDEGTKMLAGDWNAVTWVYTIRDIDGKPADPNNPRHFIKATGADGNPMRVMLNGRGVPADSYNVSGYYLSVADSNTGNAITDTDFWIPLLTTETPEEWSEELWYYPGAVVTLGANYYALVQDLTDDISIPPDQTVSWVELTTPFLDAGDYSAGTGYSSGQYVRALSTNSVGKRRVEYYNESNFLLLGIPVEIRCPTVTN